MDFQAIKALVHDDLQAVNREIGARLQSDVALINQLAGYIVNSGGKRLRPMIVLLGAKALGHDGETHVKLAAVIEFIHTATLLKMPEFAMREQMLANARIVAWPS